MAKKVNIRVISGGQIGADKIGLEEAKKLGFQTGGTAPKRFYTTRGRGVDVSLKDFGLTEVSDEDTASYKTRTGKTDPYGPRTEQNVLKSDVTLIYTIEGHHDSPGSKLTRNLAIKHKKPYLQNPTSSQVAELVSGLGKEDVTINIAGNREFTDRKVISKSLQAASNPSANMPKKVIVGDIWKQKGFKVVSTNLGGVHGRGLAAQAKQKGFITRFNKSFATSPKNSDVITLAVKGNAPETARINVGGKPQAYSEQTSGKNIELLKSEVKELIKFARQNPTKNINLPFIGLGFGEGNPDDILPILREAEKEPNIYLISKDEATVKRYQSTFRAGVRSDKSIKNISQGIRSRIGPPKQTNAPSGDKAIWFQGPSSEIEDPKAFKRALTKRYRQARKKHGNVQVLYRGESWSQADQLIGEWASEGFRKYRHAKQLDSDFKTMSKTNRSPQLFRTNEKGMPIIDKEPIKINRIQVPKSASKEFVNKQLDKWQENKQLIDRASFSRKGDVVYPGKLTKPHWERFEELIKSPRQGGFGLKKGFEAYLDEIEDIGKGSTWVDTDIKDMLAGLQVAEDKSKYYSLDDATKERISHMKKDVSEPLKSGEYIGSSDVDDPDIQSIISEDDLQAGPEDLNKQYQGRGPFQFGKFGLKAVLSKSDELKPKLNFTDKDDKVHHLRQVDQELMSEEDKEIRKENKQFKQLKNIVMPPKSGGKGLKSQRKDQRQRVLNKGQFARIYSSVIGDVYKSQTDSVLGITSDTDDPVVKKKQQTTVIKGPHSRGILIRADPKLLAGTDARYSPEKERLRLKLEKKYIKGSKVTRKPDDYPRNVSKKEIALQVRKEITKDQKQIKIQRVAEKISRLRSSGARSLAGIKSYIASSSNLGKTQGAQRYGLMPWMVKSVKDTVKSFPKKPHTPGLKVDAPIDARPKIKIKKVTASMQKYHKPITKEAGIKAMESKLKVTADKKALPVNKELTSKVTKELQKKFHGKDKPRYKSTVGKGLKFTRGLGAFTIFSSILGLVRGRAEARKELGREPTIMETFNYTVLPEKVRKQMPKYQRKFTNVQELQ